MRNLTVDNGRLSTVSAEIAASTGADAAYPSLGFRETSLRADELVGKSRAANTIRAYRADWIDFEAWCRARGYPFLPADPAAVSLYVASLSDSRTVSTIQRRLVSISRTHKAAGLVSPTVCSKVREVLKGLVREKGSAQRQKCALATAELKAILASCGTNLPDARDRALLLLGFSSAMRRSERVALRFEDISFVAGHGLRLVIRKSKTDQDGWGREVGIPFGRDSATCAVLALRSWLHAARIIEGPIFRKIDRYGTVAGRALNGAAVAMILKKRAHATGLDEKRFAGHSLRAGFCTAAAASGATERSIMAQTGHRSERMLRRYIRTGSLFRDNAAATVDL